MIPSLDPDEKRMYATEKEENFRWIARILASQSSYTLAERDRAPTDTEKELEELGQFAEIASNNTVPIAFILENIKILTQPNFPLQDYHSLQSAVLISEFFGDVAELHCYVCYRPAQKQLLVATSGTTSPIQAMQDLRFLLIPHPSGTGRVHTGFQTLYDGLRLKMFAAIQKGFEDYDVEELVLTGHSMGGAISYLLALDILTGIVPISNHPRVKVATFGAPRAGDEALVTYWREIVKTHRATHGPQSMVELCVKGFNDGVHTLPPYFLGYRHFTPNCFWYAHGNLYSIPPSECEVSLFKFPPSEHPLLHRKGGHNYYNKHDMEKVLRRLKLVDVKLHDWKDKYRLALELELQEPRKSILARVVL
ncbi:alpha/beta-hydrolase [Cylindrobasidium torrendii FP15055 ss-10]|uniref:Alpha/beta-hydrolase n=1 Tax=Cylindrobasidium torrendii FP15055 ss-10 TaxID=1314674 RepID=A0A0D7BSV3_9AGAR|nr:alpha/beta-hydrolase [Cylindrobasidium torrendii FP15055 ss-10]